MLTPLLYGAERTLSMSKAYRAAVGRRGQEPPKIPAAQEFMLELHRDVIEENLRQKAKRYSLRDERGETFSLAYWSDFERKETVLIPAGTPILEKNLHWAFSAFLRSMEETNFGKWSGDRGRAEGMERVRQLIRELEEREAKEAAENG